MEYVSVFYHFCFVFLIRYIRELTLLKKTKTPSIKNLQENKENYLNTSKNWIDSMAKFHLSIIFSVITFFQSNKNWYSSSLPLVAPVNLFKLTVSTKYFTHFKHRIFWISKTFLLGISKSYQLSQQTLWWNILINFHLIWPKNSYPSYHSAFNWSEFINWGFNLWCVLRWKLIYFSWVWQQIKTKINSQINKNSNEKKNYISYFLLIFLIWRYLFYERKARMTKSERTTFLDFGRFLNFGSIIRFLLVKTS